MYIFRKRLKNGYILILICETVKLKKYFYIQSIYFLTRTHFFSLSLNNYILDGSKLGYRDWNFATYPYLAMVILNGTSKGQSEF